MGEQEYYVESRRDNIEFFFQKTKPGAVAAGAHIHDTIELLYVKSGVFTVFVDGVEYTVSSGDLILFCSNSIHRIVSGNDAENSYYVIKVKPSMLLELSVGMSFLMRFVVNRSEYRTLRTREELRGSKTLLALEALISEYEHGGFATDVAMRLYIMQLLLCILRDENAGCGASDPYASEEITEVIYAAITYIRQHFREDLNARALAAKMGVSYSYFSRTFGRIAGKPFKEYLNLTRVNYAEQMLLTTKKSVTEISAECGYNNVSYFISVYRKMKGITPYRAVHAEAVGESV